MRTVAFTSMVLASILAFGAGCDGCGDDSSGGGGSTSSSGGSTSSSGGSTSSSGGSTSSSGGSSSGTLPCPYTLCNGTCVDTSSSYSNCGACGNVCSGANQYCSNGTCLTNPCNAQDGEMICNGVCKNLLEDSQNCGACGQVCPQGETCQYAECHPPPN